MTIKNVILVTFSPTHTSLKTGKAIAQGIHNDNFTTVDLTLSEEAPQIHTTPDDLLVFALPVYGGHIAPLALQRLENLKANNTPTAIVVVYGNRAFDDALNQLHQFVTERGCQVVAAAAFVGEHSYSTNSCPIAEGRPNSNDLQAAKQFGQDVKRKLEQALCLNGALPIVNLEQMPQLVQPEGAVQRFITGVQQIMKDRTKMPSAPTMNNEQCNNCGTCAKVCPTHAITKTDEGHYTTQAEKCIKCCACIKFCPQQARSLQTPFTQLLYQNFKENKKPVVLL